MCRITCVLRCGKAGRLDQAAVAGRALARDALLADLKEVFERNGRRVDGEVRSVWPEPPPSSTLNLEQREIVARCTALELANTDKQWTALKYGARERSERRKELP